MEGLIWVLLEVSRSPKIRTWRTILNQKWHGVSHLETISLCSNFAWGVLVFTIFCDFPKMPEEDNRQTSNAERISAVTSSCARFTWGFSFAVAIRGCSFWTLKFLNRSIHKVVRLWKSLLDCSTSYGGQASTLSPKLRPTSANLKAFLRVTALRVAGKLFPMATARILEVMFYRSFLRIPLGLTSFSAGPFSEPRPVLSESFCMVCAQRLGFLFVCLL